MTRRQVAGFLVVCALVVLSALFVWSKSQSANAAFVDAIAAGGFHSCALQSEGTLKCWGLNTRGQVGDGTSGNLRATAVFVLESAGGDPIEQIAAITGGGAHTCALTDGAGIKCWGRNEEGQLGDGNGGGVGDFSASPVDVSGLTSGVAQVSAGTGHTCAVTTSGAAKCWGDNGSGQLGDGTFNEATSPVDVSGLGSGVASISAGESHTCAVLTAGGVKCWGLNSFGQLGDNSNSQSSTPVDVCANSTCSSNLSGIATVSAGGLHTCALTTGGGAKCWGFNNSGQLGNNNAGVDADTPVDVVGLTSGTAEVAAGREHSCARTTGGGARCWGRNNQGQVGDGSNSDRAQPANVFGLTTGVAAVAPGGFHSCALLSGAGVRCWGRNIDAQLGIGITSTKNNAPQTAIDAKRPTDTPTFTPTDTPTETPTPTHTPTETPTPTPTHTLTPYPTLKPTRTPIATPTSNSTANGALRVDATCETPTTPNDVTVTVERFVLVGSTFHVCINTGFPAGSASGYQARLHWTEAFLSLTPRTNSVNDIWGDQLPAIGGPTNGGNVSPQSTGPDDDTGSEAFIQLRADDQLNQNSSPAYSGPLAQFEFTCQAHGGAFLELRGPGVGGDSFLVSSGSPIKSSLALAFVNCISPTLDSDVDGCTNTQELGPEEMLGGDRNPFHFWDVFDTPTGANGFKDRAVTGSDFFALLGRFGGEGDSSVDPLSLPPPAPAYHPAYDRGPSAGPNAWNLTAANGSVAGTDFFAVLGQFGLDCN